MLPGTHASPFTRTVAPGGPAAGSSVIFGMVPPGVGGSVCVGCSSSKKVMARRAIKTMPHTTSTASVAILMLTELRVSLLMSPLLFIVTYPPRSVPFVIQTSAPSQLFL